MENISQIKLYLHKPKLLEFQYQFNLALACTELLFEQTLNPLIQNKSIKKIEDSQLEDQIRLIFPLNQGIDEYGVKPNENLPILANPNTQIEDNTSVETEKFSKKYFENFITLLQSLGYKSEEISKCTGDVDYSRFRKYPYSYVHLEKHGYILAESFIKGNKLILIKIDKVLPYLLQNNLINIDLSASEYDNFAAICKVLNQMNKDNLSQIDGINLIVHNDSNYTKLFDKINNNYNPKTPEIKKLFKGYIQNQLGETLKQFVLGDNPQLETLIKKYPDYFSTFEDGTPISLNTFDVIFPNFKQKYNQQNKEIGKFITGINPEQAKLIQSVILFLISLVLETGIPLRKDRAILAILPKGSFNDFSYLSGALLDLLKANVSKNNRIFNQHHLNKVSAYYSYILDRATENYDIAGKFTAKLIEIQAKLPYVTLDQVDSRENIKELIAETSYLLRYLENRPGYIERRPDFIRDIEALKCILLELRLQRSKLQSDPEGVDLTSGAYRQKIDLLWTEIGESCSSKVKLMYHEYVNLTQS